MKEIASVNHCFLTVRCSTTFSIPPSRLPSPWWCKLL